MTLPSIPLPIHGDPTIHEEQSMSADERHKTSVDDCKEETHHKDTWESIAGTWEFIYVDYFTDNPSDEDNILHDEEIVFESCIAPSLSNDEMHGEHTPRQVRSTTFTEANGERLHATSVQKLRDRDKEHITSIEGTIKLHWSMQHQSVLHPSGPRYKYKRKDITTPSLTLRLDAMMYTKTMLNPIRYTYGERAMHTIPSLTKKNHLLERKDYLEIQFLSLAKLQYLEIQFSSSAKLAGFIILVRPSICFAKIMMSRESEDSGIRNLNIQMGLAKIMRSHFQEESGTQNPKFTTRFYLGFCPLMMSYLHDNFRIQNVAFVPEFHAHFRFCSGLRAQNLAFVKQFHVNFRNTNFTSIWYYNALPALTNITLRNAYMELPIFFPIHECIQLHLSTPFVQVPSNHTHTNSPLEPHGIVDWGSQLLSDAWNEPQREVHAMKDPPDQNHYFLVNVFCQCNYHGETYYSFAPSIKNSNNSFVPTMPRVKNTHNSCANKQVYGEPTHRTAVKKFHRAAGFIKDWLNPTSMITHPNSKYTDKHRNYHLSR